MTRATIAITRGGEESIAVSLTGRATYDDRRARLGQGWPADEGGRMDLVSAIVDGGEAGAVEIDLTDDEEGEAYAALWASERRAAGE